MLNSIKIKSKNFVCCLILCVAMITFAFTGTHIKNQTVILAESNNHIVQDVSETVFGKGYNFGSTTTSTSPSSPSGWTLVESSTETDNIVKGVVNVESETSFDTEKCETIRPIMPIEDKDNTDYYKNLMINASEGSGRLAYETNKSLTLEANSFYRISVMLYTEKGSTAEDGHLSDTTASIYLTGLLDKEKNSEIYEQHKFESISTVGTWEEYAYYIDTDESASVKLQLWLGSETTDSEGAVFFNEIRILRYSEDAYYKQLSDISDEADDQNNIISLSQKYDAVVENGNFEDGSLNGWERITTSTLDNSEQLYDAVDVNTFSIVNSDLSITPPGSNCSRNNQLALFLYNKNDGYQAVESSTFTIEKQTYYKINFWAKSDCNIGNGATVKLVDKSENNPVSSASLTLATNFTKNSNTFRNDWTNYSFYVYGPATGSKTVTVQIWLGTEESKTSGYVFVDDFKIQKVNYETFSKNSSSTNCTSFNLNNESDKYTIANGNFDKTQNENSQKVYPAVPSNWTKTENSSKNSDTFSGIVNTIETSFKPEDFGTTSVYPTVKPGLLINEVSEDNNVLMIGSTDPKNQQTYQSDNITLEANSFYNLSCYVFTDYIKEDLSTNYGARISLLTDTETLFAQHNILFEDNQWHKINVKIKTGTNSKTAKINLSFDNLIGYVYFDRVELNKISSEDVFNDKSFDTSTTKYVDLSFENFDNRTFNKNYTNIQKIEKVNNWTFNSNSEIPGIIHGIISSDNSIVTDIAPAPLSENKNYLYINALHDASHSYTSNESYTFNADNYYKISVNVLTKNISTSNDEDVVNGARIALKDSAKIMIKGINTDGIWKTYTIYTKLKESLTSAIVLGLGDSSEETSGQVLFDNLVIKTITEEEYNTELDGADLSTIATFIDHTELNNTEDNNNSVWENNFNWLLVPSIITALAIIIAVVGFYVRKIKFNRKPKIKTNYDRRKTLDKDIDRREKIALRKQIIDELNAELKAIDIEISDFNKLTEEHLEKVKIDIQKEQEELNKQKIEIEIKKKEATAERERKLKESPEFVSDIKAEKEYNNFIAKLDKQELSIQKKINEKSIKYENVKTTNKDKLTKYLERKEYIQLQIAKIEAEIEEIARQEEQMWAEYKAAKEDAKRRKAEYKAQLKAEKEKQKLAKEKKSSDKVKTKNETTQTKTATKKEDNSSAKKSSKKETSKED